MLCLSSLSRMDVVLFLSPCCYLCNLHVTTLIYVLLKEIKRWDALPRISKKKILAAGGLGQRRKSHQSILEKEACSSSFATHRVMQNLVNYGRR